MLIGLAVAIVVGCAVGGGTLAVLYQAHQAAQEGCKATHTVIANINDYLKMQRDKIERGFGANARLYMEHPQEKAKAIEGYNTTIKALGNIKCH